MRRPTTAAPYAVRVQARLDPRWASRFDGCTLTHDADGTTVISCATADQAALHGVLQVVRDLGLTLLSVSTVRTGGQPLPGHPAAAAPAPSSAAATAAAPRNSRSRT